MADQALELVDLLALVGRVQNAQGEVGAVKARDEDLRVREPELFADVCAHLRRRGRRQRDDLRVAQLLDGRPHAQVIGAEVMAPVRDAVRLVHGKQAHAGLGDGVHERLAAEALGRDVEQLVFAHAQAAQANVGLRVAQAGVDEGAGDTALGELIDLVFHQSDQRRNHQRRAVAHQGGQLVAQRLAATRRHDDDRVAAREHRLDDFILALAEVCEAKMLLQRLARRRGLAHSVILAAVVAVVGCAGL